MYDLIRSNQKCKDILRELEKINLKIHCRWKCQRSVNIKSILITKINVGGITISYLKLHWSIQETNSMIQQIHKSWNRGVFGHICTQL